MKVLFLISDGFGIGGTIRTTFNLAGVLASRGHDVEVLSSFRRRDAPQMPVDPAVRLMSLLEVRKDHPDYDATDPLRGQPAVVYPRADFRAADYDLLVEDRCARYLRDSDADVVIGTRPGLIAWISRFAPERMIRIGQEHLTRAMHSSGLRTEMVPHYRRLDAFVTVSARDAEDYRERLRLPDTRLLFIPNSVPAPQVPPSDGRQKLVVAAGRIVASKRYDVLVRAFAKVVAERPDWRLRVYGRGVESTEIRRLVVELGLHNHVLMMGGYSPIEPEWAKGAIAAVPSDKEPFGMTLVEAMRCGLPVVSTDAPYGPAEILDDGQDGLLTPVGDPDAMADALLRVIGDGERRRSMAAAALANSARYDPKPVADRYEELFAELAADKARRRRSGGLRRTLSRLRGHTTGVLRPTGPPATVLGPAASSSQPTADCTITGDGDVVLRLSAAALPAEPALVWRRTGTGGATAPVPMPVRDGDALALTVYGEDVPEGAWELHLAGSGEHPDPVMAGLRDTRALLDAASWDFEAPDRGGVQVRLPYRSAAGVFGLRVWRRAVHPEVGDVQLCDGELQFGGRLFGAPFGTGEPVLELRRRTAEKLTECVAVSLVGSSGFQVTVPVAQLAEHRPAEQDMWDMWLRYDETAPAVRLGRFLDDVVNKHTAYVYPDVVVPDPGAGAGGQAVRVQPCYTAQNEFSVRVTALPS